MKLRPTLCAMWFSVLLCLWSGVAHAEPGNIQLEHLPRKAQNFMKACFNSTTFTQAERINDPKSTYRVRSVSGIIIDFDRSGNWVVLHNSYDRWYIPQELLPEKIRTYISEEFPNDGYKITQLERIGKNYRINLSNGVLLYLDSKANPVKE